MDILRAHTVLYFGMADFVVTPLPHSRGYRVIKNLYGPSGRILTQIEWEFLKSRLGTRAICL